MSGPVTIVESGGAPVLQVEGSAPVLTAVERGGAPITLSANGAPFVIQGYAPPPSPLGPLDFASIELGVFDNFSREYDLASDSAVLGLCARYTGDPVIEIAHGGEPLTIIQDNRENGLLSLIAAGTGLTLETAALTITVTGGSVGGGALRINEMVNVAPALYGWNAGATSQARGVSSPPVTGSQGGVTKIAAATSVNDPYLATKLIGADSVWRGFLTTGPIVPVDMTESGNWTLGDGWSWVNGELVHTGPQSTAYIPITSSLTSNLTRGRCHAVIGDNARLSLTAGTTTTYSGLYDGYMAAGWVGSINLYELSATGDVVVSDMSVVTNAKTVTWIFGSAPTVDGAVYRIETSASGPNNSISAAEILGEDYS